MGNKQSSNNKRKGNNKGGKVEETQTPTESKSEALVNVTNPPSNQPVKVDSPMKPPPATYVLCSVFDLC